MNNGHLEHLPLLSQLSKQCVVYVLQAVRSCLALFFRSLRACSLELLCMLIVLRSVAINGLDLAAARRLVMYGGV